MGLIDIIKPLFTVLSSAVNKSQQHQEKNSCEHWESSPGKNSMFSTSHPLYRQFFFLSLSLSFSHTLTLSLFLSHFSQLIFTPKSEGGPFQFNLASKLKQKSLFKVEKEKFFLWISCFLFYIERYFHTLAKLNTQVHILSLKLSKVAVKTQRSSTRLITSG